MRRGHRVRRRGRRALSRAREAGRDGAGAPDPGRERSPARPCHPPLGAAYRAHGRPVRDHREADEALESLARGRQSSRASSTWVSAAPRWSGVALCLRREETSGQARALHQLDDLVDNANRQVFHEVLGYVHDAEALEWGMRQITVARCFERIGDNAVDIRRANGLHRHRRVRGVHGRLARPAPARLNFAQDRNPLARIPVAKIPKAAAARPRPPSCFSSVASPLRDQAFTPSQPTGVTSVATIASVRDIRTEEWDRRCRRSLSDAAELL